MDDKDVVILIEATHILDGAIAGTPDLLQQVPHRVAIDRVLGFVADIFEILRQKRGVAVGIVGAHCRLHFGVDQHEVSFVMSSGIGPHEEGSGCRFQGVPGSPLLPTSEG
jgi:hypothetical protein